MTEPIKFKVLSEERIEEKYNCTATRNSSHHALVKSIIQDTLRQVVELLGGTENPFGYADGGAIPAFEKQYMAFNEAIQTIKQALQYKG